MGEILIRNVYKHETNIDQMRKTAHNFEKKWNISQFQSTKDIFVSRVPEILVWAAYAVNRDGHKLASNAF